MPSQTSSLQTRRRAARPRRACCCIFVLSMTMANVSAFKLQGTSPKRNRDGYKALGSLATYYPMPQLNQRSTPFTTTVSPTTKKNKKNKNRSQSNRVGIINKLFPNKKRKAAQDFLEYQRRTDEWASQYTNVDSLREIFGSNQNPFWGDLDPTTTRRLYKKLLPRFLLDMLKSGAQLEDLAPLAYQARVAAKMYARERSQVPARIAATMFDLLRNFQKYGTFQPNGMSYDQLWNKYKNIVQEEAAKEEDGAAEEDVTARICLKILEGSCRTNQGIDEVLLQGSAHNEVLREQERDLQLAVEQLNREVNELLLQYKRDIESEAISAQRISTLRLLVRAKQRLAITGISKSQDMS